MKKYIIGFILGAIIFSTISVYATIYYEASQINYKNTTLDHAIDDLYTTQNTTISNKDSQITTLQNNVTTLTNKYDNITFKLDAQGWSSSTNSIGKFSLNNINNKWIYFKVTNLTKSKGNGTCTYAAWKISTNSVDDISLNTKYLISDYENVFVRSKSSGTEENICSLTITLSNS